MSTAQERYEARLAELNEHAVRGEIPPAVALKIVETIFNAYMLGLEQGERVGAACIASQLYQVKEG